MELDGGEVSEDRVSHFGPIEYILGHLCITRLEEFIHKGLQACLGCKVSFKADGVLLVP